MILVDTPLCFAEKYQSVQRTICSTFGSSLPLTTSQHAITTTITAETRRALADARRRRHRRLILKAAILGRAQQSRLPRGRPDPRRGSGGHLHPNPNSPRNPGRRTCPLHTACRLLVSHVFSQLPSSLYNSTNDGASEAVVIFSGGGGDRAEE